MNVIRKKVNQKIRYKDSGLVRLLDDIDLMIGDEFLNAIGELYQEGYSPEEIGQGLGIDPDKIFISLFHLVREGRDLRPIAERKVTKKKGECQDVR